MSRRCDLSNKGVLVGRRVSHSHIRTKHRFLPNLHKKRFWSEQAKEFYTLKVAISTMRTIDGIGLDAYLKKVGIPLSSIKKRTSHNSKKLTTDKKPNFKLENKDKNKDKQIK